MRPRRPSEGDLAHILQFTSELWPSLTGARILFCGGTGFVGTWLLEAFVAANRAFGLNAVATVVARKTALFRERSPHLAHDDAIAIQQGDVTQLEFGERRFEAVLHLVTSSPGNGDAADRRRMIAQDAHATRRILEIALAAQARYTLFTSSGTVYGPQRRGVERIEEDERDVSAAADHGSVCSAYGQSKCLSEQTCTRYSSEYDLDVKIARLFTFAGPLLPLDEGYAFGNFVGDALAGRDITVCGDGTPYRSYLYAADLAIWLWTILLRGKTLRPYNVGSEHAITIGELARTIGRIAAPPRHVRFGSQPIPGALVARYVPSVERARRELGLLERIPLDEAIARTCEFYGSAR